MVIETDSPKIRLLTDMLNYRENQVKKMQVEIVDLKRELFLLQKFMNKDIQRVQLATGKHIWLPAGQMKIANDLNDILYPSLSVTSSLSVAEDRLRSWPAADNHGKKNNHEKKDKGSFFF